VRIFAGSGVVLENSSVLGRALRARPVAERLLISFLR
jgi:hypothetical protein